MAMRTDGGRRTAETVDDLANWLRNMIGCPPITRTVALECAEPRHADEPASWFFVEADATEGLARVRCLACGNVRPLLDSAERWTYPPTWSCVGCGQSIAEVVLGLHEEQHAVTWLAVAVRCVGCGAAMGLTDLVVPGIDSEEFTAQSTPCAC